MTVLAARKASERRAEHLLNDLLISQGWDLRRPPHGDLLLQQEYRAYPELVEPLLKASKSGEGQGIPEAIIVDRKSMRPLAIIEAKRAASDITRAVREAQGYGLAFVEHGYNPLAIGLAGTSEEAFKLEVSKWGGSKWTPITYERTPINWIPTRNDLERLAVPTAPAEIRPTIPPPEVLADRADEINRLLREADIKDEYRPSIVAAIMLALWESKGQIRREPAFILKDINDCCREAFVHAGKASLANSLRIDTANEKLRVKAQRIARILERLNVTVLTAEHDYLGQLYETFFRYTGGNTIGQYFTPRHVARMMVDVCEVTQEDIVLDPACGTGGFLVAAMERLQRQHNFSRVRLVEIIKDRLIGFETEPVTAALCVANMILRGDGKTGVHGGDCFTSPQYPVGKASVVVSNPPFPHKQTDTPVEDFVERGLEALHNRGKLAIILPTSLLVKSSKGEWREQILAKHTLLAVCQLPDELFQPFASATTSTVLLQKGVPHNSQYKSAFVRLHHDGLTLRKGVRVTRATEPNQIPDAIDTIINKRAIPGFSGIASVKGSDEWAVGAYIESAVPEDAEIRQSVDVLLRRLASFYTRYAAEIVKQRGAIEAGDMTVSPYRELITGARIANAATLPSAPGTIGESFDIFYGMKELHSREGYSPGRSLIISPTEDYNGCYGWLEFPQLIAPSFVTVAQTGSIGEAFIQMEPCAVNDDCLILLPKEGQAVSEARMVLAAATLIAEKWRFTYGRKLTPPRIASFKLPSSPELFAWVMEKLQATRGVIAASLAPYIEPEEGDMPKKKTRIAAEDKRLSMHGVNPVDALRAFMQVDPKRIAAAVGKSKKPKKK